ncbi:hypothetical protein HELRODRAFT_159408 [Helobdella robusta]|uniref:Corticotropin-releasing factor domain-containing protein n=1 Tax=Helobdella robusta TaxID=6412 RepID=T1EP04_HELRO|nr:hypothetical protein HELRODRAFT_159408 [Helobdella robusta]ESO12821.1 hypothetical protein HELRODRAFT_159408 [Helobdella robusta]
MHGVVCYSQILIVLLTLATWHSSFSASTRQALSNSNNELLGYEEDVESSANPYDLSRNYYSQNFKNEPEFSSDLLNYQHEKVKDKRIHDLLRMGKRLDKLKMGRRNNLDLLRMG